MNVQPVFLFLIIDESGWVQLLCFFLSLSIDDIWVGTLAIWVGTLAVFPFLIIAIWVGTLAIWVGARPVFLRLLIDGIWVCTPVVFLSLSI